MRNHELRVRFVNFSRRLSDRYAAAMRAGRPGTGIAHHVSKHFQSVGAFLNTHAEEDVLPLGVCRELFLMEGRL